MGFYVVARPSLSRDLIVSFLVGEGLAIEATLASVTDIPEGDPAPAVLVHMCVFDPALKEDLITFRAQFPRAQILLLAAEQVRGLLDQELLANVETVLSDRAPMQTFRGILQSLQGGADLSPGDEAPFSVGPMAAPRVTAPAPQGPADAMVQTAPLVAGRALDTPAPSPEEASMRAHLSRLSQREIAVLTRLRAGGSNKHIAEALDITESTVKVHLRACFRKIGVRNRTQAALWAAQNLPAS